VRVFENRVLRKIFGPKRDAVTGEWRRLYNKELYALYSSPNIIRVMKSRRLRWAGHMARMGERRCAYRALVGKPEGNNMIFTADIWPHGRHLWVSEVHNMEFLGQRNTY
jgi:hypothetical protein